MSLRKCAVFVMIVQTSGMWVHWKKYPLFARPSHSHPFFHIYLFFNYFLSHLYIIYLFLYLLFFLLHV